jgi:glutamyl-tRNA reductase
MEAALVNPALRITEEVSPKNNGRIVVVGLNHKTAPVEVREGLAVPPDEIIHELETLAQLSSVREAVFLSTCNRVEVVAAVVEGVRAASELGAHICNKNPAMPDRIQQHLYTYMDGQAVQHLFRVASSLDSMILGEPQILGQIKEAYLLAVKAGTAGPILHRLFHSSFRVAKRVRSETGIASRAVSVGHAAVELARKIFNRLENKTVMLIGAGEMGDSTARYLVSKGVKGIMITNRTFERAIESARMFGGNPIRFEDFCRYVELADVVIGSSGGSLVLSRPIVEQILKARKHRPMLFIDLGVPRNFDPEINELNDVYLYNIDDLEGVIEDNRQERTREALKAEAIAAEEAHRFFRWLESLQSVPTIVELRQKLEGIGSKEMQKTLAGCREMTPKQLEAVQAMTEAIVKKILHAPISLLKNASDSPLEIETVSAVRRVFGLDGEE